MSRRIFAPSAALCFFAERFQVIRGLTYGGAGSTHIDCDYPGYSQKFQIPSVFVFETWFCFQLMDAGARAILSDWSLSSVSKSHEAGHSHNM